MKNIIIIMIFVISQYSYSGILKLSNISPKMNEAVELKYSPDGRFEDFNGLKASIYGFNEMGTLPDAYEISLNYDKATKTASGIFVVPVNMVFALIKIDGKNTFYDIYDDNKGLFWDLIVLGEDDKPMKSAHVKAGLSYLGNMPSNFNRLVNLRKALQHLENEIKYYPKNIQAQIGYTSLLFDQKKLTATSYEEEMKKLMKSEYDSDNENDLRAMSRTLRTLNKNKTAESLERKFVNNHPGSSLAEEMALSGLSTASSIKEFSLYAKRYISDFPKSPNREKIFSALATSYLQVSKYEELKEELLNLKNIPPMIFSQISLALLKNKKILKNNTDEERRLAAQDIYNEKVKSVIYDDNYALDLRSKPGYYTDGEWEIDRTMMRGNLAEASAELFLGTSDNTTGIILLEKALKLQSFSATGSLFEKLIESMINNGDNSKAIHYGETAIKESKATLKIESKLKELYQKQGLNFDTEVKKLVNMAEERRLTKLRHEKLDQKSVTGIFKTLDDRIYDFEDLKGKVSVINFWSTWCGPCQDLMPAFEALFNDYKNHTDIFIFGMNVWEKSEDRGKVIYTYLKDNDYEFPIFYDENDIIPRNIGITGLPVTVFLDKEGKVQFIEKGFTNDDHFLQKADDILNLLLTE